MAKIDGINAEIGARQERAIARADAAMAFDTANDMEMTLRKIARAASAVRLIALSEGLEGDVGDALHLLAAMIAKAAKAAEKKRAKIYHRTWAYKCAPDRVAAPTKKPEEITWPKDTLDRMQAFIDERRPDQISEAGAEGVA